MHITHDIVHLKSQQNRVRHSQIHKHTHTHTFIRMMVGGAVETAGQTFCFYFPDEEFSP